MIPADSHLPFDRLVDLVEGRLPPAEQDSSAAHLATCSHCREEFAWAEHTLHLMRSDAAQRLDERAVAGLIGQFVSRQAQRRSRRLIEAALRFDSLRPQPSSGVRAPAPFERQLLFEAEDLTLDLRVVTAGALCEVSGQVLGAAEFGYVVLEGPGEPVQASLNHLYEFKLPPVPPGNYVITLELPALLMRAELLLEAASDD